jgi:hypothetical protein
MVAIPDIQSTLFQQIKDSLPANVSYVHEIAETLSISYDSAYRRIRGEKELSFEELYKLSTRFGLSIDSLFGLRSNNILFSYFTLGDGNYDMAAWFQNILKTMKELHAMKEKEIIYAAKDIPFFHYFNFPEIAAFKVFFWQKTLFDFPDFGERQFRLDESDNQIQETGRQILALSTRIPTTEIWNEDTFNITLRQIEYYWVSGYFAKKDDLLNLCDKLEKWVTHIHKQAEYGYKFIFGQAQEGSENSFHLYENEVVLNDNTILVKTGDSIRAYLTYNVLGLLINRDPAFCKYIETYLRGLLRKSDLISVSGTKERNRFFNRLRQTIGEFRERIA